MMLGKIFTTSRDDNFARCRQSINLFKDLRLIEGMAQARSVAIGELEISRAVYNPPRGHLSGNTS